MGKRLASSHALFFTAKTRRREGREGRMVLFCGAFENISAFPQHFLCVSLRLSASAVKFGCLYRKHRRRNVAKVAKVLWYFSLRSLALCLPKCFTKAWSRRLSGKRSTSSPGVWKFHHKHRRRQLRKANMKFFGQSTNQKPITNN
jgi:hypothetical protein